MSTPDFIVRRGQGKVIIPKDVFIHRSIGPITADEITYLAPLLKELQDSKALPLGFYMYDAANAVERQRRTHEVTLYNYFERNGFITKQLLLFYSVTCLAPNEDELAPIRRVLFCLLQIKKEYIISAYRSLFGASESIIPIEIYTNYVTPEAPTPTLDYVASLLKAVQIKELPELNADPFFRRLIMSAYFSFFSNTQLFLFYGVTSHGKYKEDLKLIREVVYEILLSRDAVSQVLSTAGIFKVPFRNSLMHAMCNFVQDIAPTENACRQVREMLVSYEEMLRSAPAMESCLSFLTYSVGLGKLRDSLLKKLDELLSCGRAPLVESSAAPERLPAGLMSLPTTPRAAL